MRDGTLQRHDEKVEYGQYRSIWALKVPDVHPIWDEYLVCLYSLESDGVVPILKYQEDMTHEFIVVALGPDVKVDFEKEIFDQNSLQPLVPPNHAYQFRAENNEAAKARVGVLVNSILSGSISPDTDAGAAWDMLWSDGVSLRKS